MVVVAVVIVVAVVVIHEAIGVWALVPAAATPIGSVGRGDECHRRDDAQGGRGSKSCS